MKKTVMNEEDIEKAYFIRLTINKNGFVHFNPGIGYVIKQGCIGACIFCEKKGKEFILEAESMNLELVKFREVIQEFREVIQKKKTTIN